MTPERIVDGEQTLAIVLRSGDWAEGLNFLSESDDFQQVGTWNYKKGQKLSPHIHLIAPRRVLTTQEVVFVKDGKVKADIYTGQKQFIKSVELHKGDTIILLNGGHGYEILEDNTRVLEVKNGPYVGPERDRQRI